MNRRFVNYMPTLCLLHGGGVSIFQSNCMYHVLFLPVLMSPPPDNDHQSSQDHTVIVTTHSWVIILTKAYFYPYVACQSVAYHSTVILL